MIRDLLPEFSLGLAPMDEITTKEYRRICKRYGADVLFTEFVSSDALIRDVDKSYRKIEFTTVERPIAIQIFGSDSKTLIEAALRAEALHPDWIDINWGCPMKKIATKGAGSGILQTPEKMIDISREVVKNVKIPVSIKTRLAYDDKSQSIDSFAERLQDIGIQLLSIHARTKVQMYKGLADWSLIGKIKQNPRIKIPIFGNGDIDSAEKMLLYKEKYNVDGILIGRAAIGNPFIFLQCKQLLKGQQPQPISLQEKASVCKEHFNSLVLSHGEERAIVIMKKFYGKYFNSIPNFKPIKLQLMEAQTSQTINLLLEEIVQTFS